MSTKPGPGAVRAAYALGEQGSVARAAAVIISEQTACDAMAEALEQVMPVLRLHAGSHDWIAAGEALRLHREGPAK